MYALTSWFAADWCAATSCRSALLTTSEQVYVAKLGFDVVRGWCVGIIFPKTTRNILAPGRCTAVECVYAWGRLRRTLYFALGVEHRQNDRNISRFHVRVFQVDQGWIRLASSKKADLLALLLVSLDHIQHNTGKYGISMIPTNVPCPHPPLSRSFHKMPNLVVSAKFNPPTICLMGTTLREETVKKIDAALPRATTTSMSPKQDPPQCCHVSNPPHW